MSSSSIFLHAVTLIDAAYIDDKGMPVGLSVEPVFIVHGSTDNHEEVVLDFSKCKKRIKELIDHQETGYDHKLWIDPHNPAIALIAPNGEGTCIQTPYMSATVPNNALTYIPGLLQGAGTREEPEQSICFLQNIEQSLSTYLTQGMADLGVTVEVTIPEPAAADLDDITTHMQLAEYSFEMFDYTHGLPKSSSWGCQNIIHGHTSFVMVGREKYVENDMRLVDLCANIRDYLHDTYIYDKTDVRSINLPSGLCYGYTTNRGRFEIELNPVLDVLGLPYAPTIEGITDHVARKYAKELTQCGATCLMVSEGLLKGSLIQCTDWESR